MAFAKVWAANFGDAHGGEQRKMLRVITQLLDADMEFIVSDDRGGTGTWEIVIVDDCDKLRRDPVNTLRVLRKLDFHPRESTGTINI